MMRKIGTLALAAGLVAVSSPALATPLYGGNASKRFLSIDQSNGAMTSIAQPTTYEIHGLAWDFTNQVMYGGNDAKRFFSIDANGVQTLINGATTYDINDLVFGPGGTLYGVNSAGRFFSINPGTGAMTSIALDGSKSWSGLAYDRGTGIIYATSLGATAELYSITTGGVATLIGATDLGGTDYGINAISIDPVTGVMYGQNNSLVSDRFYTVNKATGDLTLVKGGTDYEAHGLAFVPEPGTLLLLGAGLLGLAAHGRKRA